MVKTMELHSASTTTMATAFLIHLFEIVFISLISFQILLFFVMVVSYGRMLKRKLKKRGKEKLLVDIYLQMEYNGRKEAETEGGFGDTY